MLRKFSIKGRNTGEFFQVKAGCFKSFTEKARCRSRTETVRALREGKAFFMQSNGEVDYCTRMGNLGKFNVMIEALRNLNNTEGKDSYGVCFMLSDGNQYFHTSFPENPSPKRELAKMFNEEMLKGAVILISKNPEK